MPIRVLDVQATRSYLLGGTLFTRLTRSRFTLLNLSSQTEASVPQACSHFGKGRILRMLTNNSAGFVLAFVALICCIGVPSVHAQTTDGVIVGTIMDQTGAAVPNATIT